jgi:hypothetical protein
MDSMSKDDQLWDIYFQLNKTIVVIFMGKYDVRIQTSFNKKEGLFNN